MPDLQRSSMSSWSGSVWSARCLIGHDGQALVEDHDPLATGEDLTKALRIIDAASEAVRTGKRVQVEEP